MLFPSDNEHFNSIKVRLNRVPARDGFADSRFQFHKGTIKPSIDKVPNRLHFHFNSIKVRLNLVYILHSYVSKVQFQFHKGTIKPFSVSFVYSNFYSISIP